VRFILVEDAPMRTHTRRAGIGALVAAALALGMAALAPPAAHADGPPPGNGRPHCPGAKQCAGVVIEQRNVQRGANAAVGSADAAQTIAQGAANTADVQAGAGADVFVLQTNVQIARNIAVNSPDASQTITQFATNQATVSAGAGASVAVSQCNVQIALNIAINSPGIVQSIVQVAANAAQVTVGTGGSAAVHQCNVQMARNIAVGGVTR